MRPPSSISQLLANDQFETGPYLVHGSDLDFHEPETECRMPDDIFYDVCLDAGCFLRPRHPQHTSRAQVLALAWQILVQIGLSITERVDKIELTTQL